MAEGPLQKQVNRPKCVDHSAGLPRPVGRPTKYLPEYCDLVEQFMARGFSLGAFAGFMGVCRTTITTWIDENPPGMLSIGPKNIHGFMEAVHGLTGTNLDLILHSPGGSAEAAEAVVLYLRSKFDHIRVFVPLMAMSATMLACGADEIVMGKHSFIGPIDPQLQLQTALGARFVPAQAIIEQFELAKTQAANPMSLRAWPPMLSQYGPDLLVTCTNATNLAETLVTDWLASHMFKGDQDAAQKARDIGHWLADYTYFMTHGRPISRDAAEQKRIVRLETNQSLQDVVLSVFHATVHTFARTGAVKIIENQLGKSYLDVMQQMMIVGMPPQQPPQPTQPSQPPP